LHAPHVAWVRRLLALLACSALAACSRSHAESSRQPQGKPGSILLLDALDQPVAEHQLLVDGELVTTDAEGSAELGALPEQYDVALRVYTSVYLFQGMRTRAPVIQLPYETLGPDVRRLQITVHVPPAPDERIHLLHNLMGPGVDAWTMGTNGDVQGNPWAFVEWAGAETATLVVEAFGSEIDPETQQVAHYTRYARLQREVDSNDDLSDLRWEPDFEAFPFAEKAIRVETQLRPDEVVFQHSVNARTAQGGYGSFGAAGSADSKLLVPDLPDVSFDVSADTSGPHGTTVNNAHGLLPGDHVRLVPQGPPKHLSEDDPDAECSREFAWSEVPDAIYYVQLNPDDFSSAYSYELVTSSTHVTLPDLSALGVPTPSGDYGWWPNSVGGPTSVDEYAAGRARRRQWGLGLTRRCHFSSDG
jgi:hypothetical protein